jgi:hypothetical protein
MFPYTVFIQETNEKHGQKDHYDVLQALYVIYSE